jgi:acetyl-CoA carboxylase biotin carboxyl carrier protein
VTEISGAMSANVVKVCVSVGDEVNDGDTLVVVEAMKMEMPITATAFGTVDKICVEEGQHVQPNQVLVVVA